MSLTTFEDDVIDYEDETPFLKNDDSDPRKPTPLPMKQISVLLVLWIAESVIDNSISPYLNQVRYDGGRFCEAYSRMINSRSARQRPPGRGRRRAEGGLLHRDHSTSLLSSFSTWNGTHQSEIVTIGIRSLRRRGVHRDLLEPSF